MFLCLLTFSRPHLPSLSFSLKTLDPKNLDIYLRLPNPISSSPTTVRPFTVLNPSSLLQTLKMDNNIPDLNDTFVIPLFYYNLAQGYMCPDSVDGFDYPDGIEDGDVLTPYVRIPFDQDLAEFHLGESQKEKDEVSVGKEVVKVAEPLLGEGDGFLSWLDGKKLGENMTADEAEKEMRLWRGRYEAWKDMFVVFCPAAMHIPDWKGGLLYSVIIYSLFYLFSVACICCLMIGLFC